MLYHQFSNDQSDGFGLREMKKDLFSLNKKKQMNRTSAAEALDALMVMPRGNSIREKQMIDNVVRFTYQCSIDGCDFQPAIQQIERSEDLQMLKLRNTIKRSVQIIDSDQGRFCTRSVSGYRFESEYLNVVLSNESIGLPKAPENRIGLFQIDQISKLFVRQEQMRSEMMMLASTATGALGCFAIGCYLISRRWSKSIN